jgi:hypothetical protein
MGARKGTPMGDDRLEHELVDLERSVGRRARVLAFLSFAVFVVPPLILLPAPVRTFRNDARQLRAGLLLPWWRGDILLFCLWDRAGNERCQMAMTRAGTAVFMSDERGKMRAALGLAPDAFLHFFDESAALRIRVGVLGDGRPLVGILAKGGRAALWLGEDNAGNPTIRAVDRNGVVTEVSRQSESLPHAAAPPRR